MGFYPRNQIQQCDDNNLNNGRNQTNTNTNTNTTTTTTTNNNNDHKNSSNNDCDRKFVSVRTYRKPLWSAWSAWSAQGWSARKWWVQASPTGNYPGTSIVRVEGTGRTACGEGIKCQCERGPAAWCRATFQNRRGENGRVTYLGLQKGGIISPSACAACSFSYALPGLPNPPSQRRVCVPATRHCLRRWTVQKPIVQEGREGVSFSSIKI